MANHTGTTVNSQLRIRDIFLSTLSFLREVVLLLVFVVTDLVVTASRWLVPVRYQAKCLDGHVVVVTGSGSGIGRLMALEFAKRRCRVVLWGKHLDDVGPVAQEITSLGGEAYAYECDCSCRDSVFQTAARMEAEVGTADIVVNNAGVVHGKVISDCSAGIVEETMGVNLLQNFWTTQAFLPAMRRKKRGHIVSMSSVAGLIGASGLTDYCASKFGVIGFCESLAMELHGAGMHDIHVTCVCPYQVDTEMFKGVHTRYSWLLPILPAEYVARRAVDAVACNWSMLVMPRIMYLVPIAKALLPVRSQLAAADFLGITSAMDTFKGKAR